MSKANTELILILAVMAVLLVFGLVSVGIFLWVLRKERGGKMK